MRIHTGGGHTDSESKRIVPYGVFPLSESTVTTFLTRKNSGFEPPTFYEINNLIFHLRLNRLTKNTPENLNFYEK